MKRYMVYWRLVGSENCECAIVGGDDMTVGEAIDAALLELLGSDNQYELENIDICHVEEVRE